MEVFDGQLERHYRIVAPQDSPAANEIHPVRIPEVVVSQNLVHGSVSANV
jgi:hypothetical protein